MLSREDSLEFVHAVNGYSQHSIFGSRSVEKTQAFLNDMGFDLQIARRDIEDLDARICGIYLSDLFLGFTQYGPEITFWSTERTDFWVHLPVSRCFAANIGEKWVEGTSAQGVVFNPGYKNVYHCEEGCSRLALSVTAEAMERQLVTLLGERPHTKLEFEPTFSIAGGFGRLLSHSMGRASFWLSSLESRREFEEFAVTGLLLSQPHSLSEELLRLRHRLAPRDVKIAIEFMEANLGRPLGLVDVVEASGVPGRTLLKHFRDSRGVSPMQFLRDRRFMRVNEALIRANSGDSTVTEIALQFGFSHMGRFSVDYRQRFGESPSETLRGRRSH